MRIINLIGTLTAFVILFYSAVLLPKLNFILLHGNVKPVIILLLILLYFLVSTFKKHLIQFSFSSFDVLFLCLIFWQGISVFWSINSIEAINVTTNWATLYIVFKFFQQICLNDCTKKYVITILIISSCLSLLIAYVAILNNEFSNIDVNFFDDSLMHLKKTYQLTKIYISTLFVLFWGVAIYLIVQKNVKIQWFGVLLFLLIYLIELLLQSRGGMLLTILILSALSALNFYLKSTSWFTIVSLIVLSITLFYLVSFLRTNTQDYLFLMDPLYGIKSNGGDDRFTMWKISYQLFLEKPLLGYGSGSWLYEYMRFDYCALGKINYTNNYFIHPHNLFIEKLFENGLPGFLLSVAFFILSPFWYFLQKLKNKTFKAEDYLWFTGVLCFTVNVMLYSTVQIGWGNFKGQVFLYLLFISQIVPKKTIPNSVYNKILSYIIISTTIFALIFYANTSYISHHFLKCSNYLKNNNITLAEKHLTNLEHNSMQYLHQGISTENLKMKLHLKKSQFKEAEASILKQLKQHPYNFNFWFQLGNILKKQDKMEQAKSAYKKALQYNCEYIPAQIKLLDVSFALNDEKQIRNMKNELLVIDDYLKLYYENEVAFEKIPKAVTQKGIFHNFKTQRDSIVSVFNTMPN